MVAADTFAGLLEQVASKHRNDIDAATQSLAEENRQLRQEVAKLQREALHIGIQSEGTQNHDGISQEARRALFNSSADEVSTKEAPLTNHASPLEEFMARIPSLSSSNTVPNGKRNSVRSSGNGVKRLSWRSTITNRSMIRAGMPGTLVGTTKKHERVNMKMDQIHKNEAIKLQRRLQPILCSGTEPNAEVGTKVFPHKLHAVLSTRRDTKDCTEQSLEAMLIELNNVGEAMYPSERLDCSTFGIMDVSIFAKLLLLEDLDQLLSPPTALEFARVRNALVTEATEEMIKRLSRAISDISEESGAPALRRTKSPGSANDEALIPQRLASTLNAVVTCVVVLSLVLLGVSLDVYPDSVWWTWIECFFAVVFVAECVIKVWYLGLSEYFLGREYAFNVMDVLITLFSVFDLVFTVASQNDSLGVSAILKGLRVLRLLRLVKLLNRSSGLLKELSSMLSGLMIGIPALLWVNVLLILLMYIVAIMFRSAYLVKVGYSDLSPAELIEYCGRGDYVKRDAFDDPIDPECRLHLIYGAEFLGSVPRAMVTVFRFMIGDTSTAAGRSLVEYLDTTDQNGATALAMPFYFFYIPFMIIVWFGIFNIITALFVETTIAGLKHNDTQNRRKRLQESRYVQTKLSQLVGRIESLVADDDLYAAGEAANMQLDEFCFTDLMSDAEVKALLADLDVSIADAPCPFEMFDPEGIGTISVADFLSTLLKLRGEAQKIDLVSPWLSLRRLLKNFHDFQQVALTSLRNIDHKVQTKLQEEGTHGKCAGALADHKVQAGPRKISGSDYGELEAVGTALMTQPVEIGELAKDSVRTSLWKRQPTPDQVSIGLQQKNVEL